jgi:hypothetical protein
MFDHRKALNVRLNEMENSRTRKYKKYPLIALRLDIPETIDDDMKTYNLNIVILDRTDLKYTAEESIEKVIKPILHPIYVRFMKELTLGYWGISWDGKYPSHTKINRPHWGIEALEGNTKNIFDDHLDGIELVNLNFRRTIKCL